MILLETTKFLRKFITLLRYDKPHTPLHFILFTITLVIVVSNVLMVLLEETDNAEKCVLAVKDFIAITSLYSSVFKRFLKPQQSIELIDLIEEEYLIDCYALNYKDKKWKRMKIHYDEKRKDVKFMNKVLVVLVIACGVGISCRYFMLDLLVADLQNRSRGKPTLYISYIPPDVDQTAFFIYIWTMQIFFNMFPMLEGLFVNYTLFQCTQKILTDFEAMFILIDQIIDEYFSLKLDNNNDNMRVKHENMKEVSSADNDARLEKLRRDVRLLVQTHQYINRTVEVCMECVGYGILVISILISMDACTGIYFMMQTNNPVIHMNYFSLCSFHLILVFLSYYTGQCISNQNAIFRSRLADIEWTGKPRWFKQSLLIMMTRANVDTELRPLGLFVLNLKSYKDLMKAGFSFGNILYTMKQTGV